jgi:hypothetical protein
MDEVDVAARSLAIMSVILMLYTVAHVVLFAISGEPVYLFVAAAGSIVAAVAAYMRRRTLR